MPPKKRAPQNKELKQSSTSDDHNNIKSSCRHGADSVVSTPKHKDKEADFVTLCRDLQVTNSLCDHAWSIWKKVADSMEKMPETEQQLWAACLYVAVIDMDVSTLGFTDLQKAAGLNVQQFLVALRRLDINIDIISPKVNSAVSRLEKKYEASLALYQRLHRIWKDLYIQTAEAESTEIFKSVWTMFQLAKGSFLQTDDDLVISFQLLVCVLEFFMKRSSPSLLKPQYSSKLTPTRSSRRNQGKSRVRAADLNEALLEGLCRENACSLDEVKHLYETVFSPFLDSSGFSKSQELPKVPVLTDGYILCCHDYCCQMGRYQRSHG